MSTLSSICRNCGAVKAVANYADLFCPECQTVKKQAEDGAPEGTSPSDRLRLGKDALNQRAHVAFAGWKNPKDFNQNFRHG